MTLDDQRIDKLTDLIQNSFRVRQDHDPIYVDIRGHLNRISAAQHEVIFGRRGSGKSCLLIHYHKNARRRFKNLSVYILADEIKTLPYPDLLIRLLLTIFENVQLGGKWRNRNFRRSGRPLQSLVEALRALLDDALTQDVDETTRRAKETAAEGGISRGPLSSTARLSTEDETQRRTQFVSNKLDNLERHLQDYKASLDRSVRRSGFRKATVLVDDFYLLPLSVQPDVIDDLHRLVRGIPVYLKVGTVRHRTQLLRRGDQTIGVELFQDVEEISLDQTFQDVEATREYLATMLDSMGRQVGIESTSTEFISPDGLLHLTLASGGVPRDFLNIFVQAVEAARARRVLKWLTPTAVYKGAGRVAYRTKLSNLRADVGDDAPPIEALFADLSGFCLKEKRKTGFLIAQNEAANFPNEHEPLQQLMDFKLIHVIEPDTSAASGRSGRYEAYTLDFAQFMEPRLRGLDHIEFWKVDAQRRREGLREAPIYDLKRAHEVLAMATIVDVDAVIEDIESSVGVEDEASQGDEAST